MKYPVRLFAFAVAWCAAFPAFAQTPGAVKPGYNVVIEITYDETGKPEDGKIVSSDDPTGDRTLDRLAMNVVSQDQQPPKMVDGKAVKFKARRPINFPVEGDQGEASNADKPVLRKDQVPGAIPTYPEALAAKDIVGGVIVELVIRADGTVRSVETLRASHPEFAQVVEAATKLWVFNERQGPGRPAESKWRVAFGFTTGGKEVDLKWRLAPRPSLGGFVVGHRPLSGEPVPAPASAPAVPEPTK